MTRGSIPQPLAQSLRALLLHQSGVQDARLTLLHVNGTAEEILASNGMFPLAPTQATHASREDGATVRLEVWAREAVPPQLLSDVAQVALAAVRPPERDQDFSVVSTEAQETQVLLRAIFETSQEAIGVSRSGIHTLVNASYLRLFGYDSADDLLGKPILPLIAVSERANIQEYVRLRATGGNVPDHYETRGLRKDGTEFDMDVQVVGYRYRDEVYTLVILRDVTLQKRADQARQDSEAFYKAMFDVNTAVKLLIDADQGVVVDANAAAAEFYGYPLQELRGKRITDINTMSEEDVFREMSEARAQRRAYFNFKHRLASGELRDVEIYSGPIEVKGRTLLLSIIHDITWRKRLEEQLQQAQKMEAVGRLAGGIAHDFNNLLTALIGYGVMALEDLPEAHSARGNVEQMVKNAQRAEQLTRQLLAFSRQQVVQPRLVNVNAVISEMKLLLQRLIGEHIQLQVNLLPGLANVRGDPGQLQQVLMNLAVNARDAMPRGGRLTIGTAHEDVDLPLPGLPAGRYVVLTVSDTGEGMDEQTRTRIFEPFFTTKGEGHGTGLGLATVYGIVQQSEGYIQVQSEKDRGAAFVIHLPRVDAPVEELAAPAPAAEVTQPATPPRTILVVEDHDDVRAFLCLSLRSGGHTILEAHGSSDAVEFASKHDGTIDLLVTDVVMPRMSGPELYEVLRRERPEMKVLYISGYTDGLISEHGMRDEQAAFLQKPFTGRVLTDKVADLLRQSPPS